MKNIIAIVTIMILTMVCVPSHAQDKRIGALFTNEPGFSEGLISHSTVRGPLEQSIINTNTHTNGVIMVASGSKGRTAPRMIAVSGNVLRYFDERTPITEATPFFLLGLGLIGLGSMGRQFIR